MGNEQPPQTCPADDIDDFPTEGFHVVDHSTANWVVRRIVAARAYRQKVEVWAAAEIRRAEREEQFFASRWGSELEAFARAQIAAQGRRKSICLPAGTIGFRVAPRRLELRNEQHLLAWCRTSLPAAIRVTERVLKGVVLKHFLQTGELPAGGDIAGGAPYFFIKP